MQLFKVIKLFFLLIFVLLYLTFSGCARMQARTTLFLKHGITINKKNFKQKLEKKLNYPIRNNNSVRVINASSSVVDEMYELIKKAQKNIYIEQYIFRYDEVGEKFIALLKEKAAHGVEVKVVIDRIGSITETPKLKKVFKKSKVKVKIYNPFLSWSILKINNRNHQKVLIVDEDTAVITGIGLGKECLFWRDIGIEVQGEVVYDLLRMFDLDWKASGKGFIGKIIPLPIFAKLKRKFDSLFLKKKKYDINNFKIDDKVKCRLFNIRPEFGNHKNFEYLVQLINESKKYVYLANAYFVPNIYFRRALRKAAKRGVDVRIIVPGKSDLPFVRRASRIYYEGLLEKNIRIYERKNKILHAKYSVIDDEWASIGSININDRCFFMNHESNINVLDKNIARKFKKIFIEDILKSREITYQQWKNRSKYEVFKEIIHMPSITLF